MASTSTAHITDEVKRKYGEIAEQAVSRRIGSCLWTVRVRRSRPKDKRPVRPTSDS